MWWNFDDDELLRASLACPYWPVSDAVSKLGSVGPFVWVFLVLRKRLTHTVYMYM